MTRPHDFEFQLGRYRTLRGRGWKGIAALCLFLTSIVLIASGTIRSDLIFGAIKSEITSLVQKH